MVPLTNVEHILSKERKNLTDLYAPVASMRLDIKNPLAPLTGRYGLSVKEGTTERELRFTPTSMNQACAIAGVPVHFMEKVPASLGLHLLRCLLEMSDYADGRPFLLRLKGKRSLRLRAVLPQSFVRFDDLQVLEEIRSVVSGNDVRVARLNVDDDTFFMRLVVGDGLNIGSLRNPDPAMPALDVLSSETGAHPMELRHALVRMVCLNGMTFQSDARKILRMRNTRMDRGLFQRAARTTFEQMVANGGSLAGTLAESRASYIKDPRGEIGQIFSHFRLGRSTGKLGRWVVDEMLKNLSLFGVQKFDIVQAFTAAARGLEHRDRMRIEDAMGSYLLHGFSKN
jgi:hypothetical protein